MSDFDPDYWGARIRAAAHVVPKGEAVMGEKMTLRDVLDGVLVHVDGIAPYAEVPVVDLQAWADTLTTHLTQPAQAVDVPKGWSAENLKRCCRELNKLIELAGDYDFDEMTVATFETSIACILVCLAALPNANGKEG